MRIRIIIAALLSAGLAHAQSTSFSYQGSLKDNGAPANGTAGIRATLWDAPSLGNQVGLIDEDTAVVVVDGLFTTELDFGPGAFDGSARYLQIEVMLPYDPMGAYSVLSMRTPVLSVPMAQHAGIADSSGQWSTVGGEIVDGVSGQVTVSPAGHVGIGGTPIGEALRVENDFTGIIADSFGGTGVVGTGGQVGVTGSGPTGVRAISEFSNGIGLFAQGSGTNGLAGFFSGQAEFTGEVGIGTDPFQGIGLWVENSFSDGIVTEATQFGVRATATASSSGIGVRGEGGFYGVEGNAFGPNSIGVKGRNIDAAGYGGHFTGRGYFSDDTGIGDSSPDARLDVVEFSTSSPVSIIERSANGTIGSDVLRLVLGSGSFSAAQFLETRLGTNIRHRLEANGDVYADGGFFPGGADFAELVPVTDGAASVEAGDVMVIDARGGFAKALSPRSTLVAGIYSTKPGVLASQHDWDALEAEYGGLNADGSGATAYDIAASLDEVPLAVVGIVPCKVSTENGVIRAGDLLVTSGTPGHAMRDDDPRNGTIVGKALESCDGATGVIRVLVTLQ